MLSLYLFLSTYLMVFLLVAQSLIVNNGLYLPAFINSIFIGGANLMLYKLAPNADGFEIVAFIIGGPLGNLSAMLLFKRLHRK